MSSHNKSKESEKAANELIATLKTKVKELEYEVSTLKARQDDLRKAKNTTVTKREREVVEVGFKRDPKYEAKLAELERQLREKSSNSKEIEELKKKHKEEIAALEKQLRERTANKNKEIDEMRRKHVAELQASLKGKSDLESEKHQLRRKLTGELQQMEEKLTKESKSSKDDGELDLLRRRVKELEGDKYAAMIENADVKERITSLQNELSIKEAQWCETEEQYKLKMKQNYGNKYEEWMAETERKIAELQEANTILRTYLHRSGTALPPGMGVDS